MDEIDFPALSTNNSKCEGCSILKLNKPFHSFMDYENSKEVDVLFLSDCLRPTYDNNAVALLPDNYILLKETIGKIFSDEISWTCLASVKCPSIKESDMTPSNMKICRQHLKDTIDKLKPKLIIPMGNLAMKMLIRKSGIIDKRGQTFYYEEIPVVPIVHPASIIYEPRNLVLFEQDIRNAYHKYILKIKTVINQDYKLINSEKELEDYRWLFTTDKTIAIDTETEGLNFLKDKLLTVSIAWDEGKAICFPVYHKESLIEPLTTLSFMSLICKNKLNRKVFHNAKFDLKMLLHNEITVINVDDTLLMQHQIEENKPKHLKDLVKEHYPEYLQEF
jgi:uracil-DNA glycosylase family 4